ncbi:hypothetical protein E2C01_070435 [Portunus trituberculatus]|uniref:Uncharacterized protein n=1 Tax=Portunus trituberculatus TaxID=210409 RepID=A0A5B7I5E8_PORTR|nr:hypothetical protein [Portunus trituberculatus]
MAILSAFTRWSELQASVISCLSALRRLVNSPCVRPPTSRTTPLPISSRVSICSSRARIRSLPLIPRDSCHWSAKEVNVICSGGDIRLSKLCTTPHTTVTVSAEPHRAAKSHLVLGVFQGQQSESSLHLLRKGRENYLQC